MAVDTERDDPVGKQQGAAIHGYFVEADFQPGSASQTISAMFRTLRKHWWFVSLCVAAGIALGAAFYVYDTPLYRATVTLAPVADSEGASGAAALGQLGGLASLAGVDIGGRNNQLEIALASLTSNSLSKSFIETNDLMPVLFHRKWDQSEKQWRGDQPPSMGEAIRRFDRRVRELSQVPNTGLYTLSITLPDRNMAAALANQLVADLNLHMRMTAIREANRNVAFLAKELEENPYLEVKQSIIGLMESQIKSKALANSREEFALKIIDSAMVPDEDDQVRPKFIPLIIAGAMMGFLLAAIALAIRSASSH